MKNITGSPAPLSKIAQTQTDLVGRWDERSRIFNTMRNPGLSDEQREQLATEYKAACREFEKARQEAIK